MKRVCRFPVPLLVLLAACNTDPRVVCRKYVDNGNNYFDRGKYREASILYRRALNKDTKYGPAWYRLGLVNIKLALYGEARKDFSRAIQLDPANTDALVQLGDLDLVFYALDPQANKSLASELDDLARELLKKDKLSYDGLRFAANAALLRRDVKTAIQRFEEANRVKPFQPQLVLALAQALFADRRNDEAVHLATELISKEKTYAPMYDLLYMFYVRTERLEPAEELLKAKIANNPSEGAYLMQLAFHYYMTGRTSEMDSTLALITSNLRAFPEGRLQVGDFYVRIREFGRALDQYESGSKENARNARACRKKMAEVLATLGQNERAARLVESLLKEDNKDPEAVALRATLELQKGGQRQSNAVIAELQPLVLKMPASAVLRYNLGRAYLASGGQANVEQARTQFEEALKIDFKYAPARLSLAELELGSGESAKAAQNAEEVLKGDPTNLAARLVRARALMNMAEYARARDDLTVALQMYPGSKEPRFQLGQLDLEERRYPEAEADFQTLADAGDSRGLAGVLEAKARQGRPDQAIAYAQRQLQHAPDRTDYRMALAGAEFRAGRCREATAQYQALIDGGTRTSESYLRLGECKLRLGDRHGGIAAIEKARELAPNDAVAELDLAAAYEEAGQHDAARKAYQDVLKAHPDNPAALNNLAYLEADDGADLDQALAYAQRAREKLPDDLNVMDTLGLIYLKKNLTDEGLQMLRELVNRKPDSATFHLHLALGLYQKGDRTLARRELEAARRNKPTRKEQDKIKAMLAKVG